MSEFKSILPVLRVADMQRSVDFYTRVLGFRSCWRSPGDGDGENCMIQSGRVEVLLSTGSHLGKAPGFAGTLYFNMDGVADFYARVKDQVEIAWPLENMDYGTREFGIHDPDGYLLAFSEERSDGGRELPP